MLKHTIMKSKCYKKILRQLNLKGIALIFNLSVILLPGCKKIIDVQVPIGNLTALQAYSHNAQAVSVATSMYSNMINTNNNFSNWAVTVFGGMSADELIPFDQNFNDLYVQFLNNNILPTNFYENTSLWTNIYSTIYTTNSLIDGVKNSSGVDDSVKKELVGEAKFIRAFCDFYLVNMFGNVPLVNSINWHNTSLLSRSDTSIVYQNIIADLKDAQLLLAPDFSVGQGQRIIPNKWAATALLARVYLYERDWADAEIQATSIINNSALFNLGSNLNNIFLQNSSEAIWQLQQSNTTPPWFNSTPEGSQLIPWDGNTQPFAYITTSLLNAFEPGDQRMTAWIDSTLYNGITYYYPYKYKVGPAQANADGSYTEYYMVFRLAEQYLIRAEARAQESNLNGATSDLNAIRTRAALMNIAATTQSDLLTAIAHERQIELFAEWGHRWFDLKRWGNATAILSANKGFSVNSNMLLYPIPTQDLMVDPNLQQNPGY